MSQSIEEDALAHFGVKGMKWGVRRAVSSMVDNAAANAEAHAKSVREKDTAIRTARADFGTKKAKLDAAKAEYQKKKVEIGKREAKKILKPARKDFWSNLEVATRKTTGEKAADDILKNFGFQPVNTRLKIANRVIEESDKTSKKK